MIKHVAWLRAAGLSCVLLLRGAHGQTELREVTGSVIDEHHEPLSGAIVYLENDETQVVLTYVTDRTGHYVFKRVRGDSDYHVWAAFRGVSTKKRFLSKFNSANEKTIVFTMHLH